MYQNEITQLYRNILGRAPDKGGLAHYTSAAASGRSLEAIRGDIYGSPEAQRYRSNQQQQQAVQGFQSQISSLQANFQQQMQAQAARFAEQQRQQQLEMERMQQQALEAQTRQAAPEQTAQVATGVGSLKIIRPGSASRFSRPELQIKSMNI